ncbi:DUF87 domain-containing protein (plasmid) [Elizabethkingia anophelis]|uniref:VirB4 family type IV secretion system protein n=1 Tax=Elizabethkingia anophelis TaxID=1117645 RepID=UPI0020B6ED21|nr:DUF87 domain-containing protein [Elizabethkingia anophelis]UTG66819.1 DUF87 domain-containing protein [Elizabethkingia anophelis]
MKNSLIGLDGNFLLGYQVELPEKYSLGEEDFDALNEYFTKALKDLPDNTIFVKHDLFNDVTLDTKEYPDNNFLQKETKEYFKGREYIKQTTNIFFVLPNRIIKNDRIKNPFRPPHKKTFVEFDKSIDDFCISVEQCVKYLNGIHLTGMNRIKVSPMDENYLLDYYDYYMSGMSEFNSVELKKEWQYLNIGNDFVSVLRFPTEDKFPVKITTCKKDSDKSKDNSVFFKNYGDQFSFNLDFKHIYCQIAVIDEKKLHLNVAKQNNNHLHKSKSIDRSNKFWAEETDKDLDSLTKNEDSERLIRCHNNIIVFAQNTNDLENKINAVVDEFKDLDIKPIRLYGDNLLAVYEYSFPLNSSRFIENHFYVTSIQTFAAFLILSGKFNSDEKGVRFNSRIDNTPVTVDIWDARKKYMFARNFMVFARTGLGKSFTLNHIISDFIAEHGKVVLVDLGGSYKKLTSLFPDRTANISHNEGDRLGLNPFDLKGEEPSAEKIEELAEYIGIHYKLNSELTDNQKVSLKKILELYYMHKSNGHSLPDFIKSFEIDKDEIMKTLDLKEKYFDADEFLLQMSQFIDNGLYAYLYEGEGEDLGADLYDKDIIVFELDQIKGNKLLLTLMLHQIYHTINKVIWKDKETRGMVIFEEFAEQLKWEGMMGRIEWFAQAIRKQNSSLGLVLQAITQLPDNDSSKSIIENTQLLYVLGAKDYRPIKERFNLSDHAFYQLNSIKSDFSGKFPYSEIFIQRGEKHQVYRLEVPRSVFWAYQTDGDMNAMLMKISDITQSLEKAIYIMVENEKLIENLKEDKVNKRISDEELDRQLHQLSKKYNYEKV